MTGNQQHFVYNPLQATTETKTEKRQHTVTEVKFRFKFMLSCFMCFPHFSITI